MCPLGSQHEHNDSENQRQNDFQSMWSMPHNENDSTIQPSINDMIWTKKKPSEMDYEATHLMLSLREEKSTYFDDKRTRKLKLWNDIAKEFEENNFHLGNKGGERCHQKFANLQKTYLSYMKHQTTTGSERIDDIPPFFDELHSILGCKHKVMEMDRKIRSEEFSFLKEHLKKTEQQKHRFLEIVEAAFGTQKRRKSDTNDSDTDWD
ncbi:unnamed protein product [Acanthoscelides obtectus]|nr:unnamed protein product [Acanthoscelides obtectus]CAK1641109.1 hypothetical protein AOBTE_LOCUS12160 [Acanthoscelides obtectus]